MKVCLDAGHGGADPGSRGALGVEKDYTLVQALTAHSVLLGRGHEVVLTRDADETVPLRRRALLANEAGADAFVSYHWNYAGAERPSGTIALHWRDSEEGRLLAELLQAEVAPLDGDEDERWDKVVAMPDADFRATSDGRPFRPYVLHATVMPAVILEVEFGSNPEAARHLESPRYVWGVAEATARALDEWDPGGE